MLPIKFKINWPYGSGIEAKIDLQDGRFPIGTVLAFTIFDHRDAFYKFQVN